MKSYIIIILSVFSFYTTYGQLPSADMARSYELEMKRFNLNITHYKDHFLAGYEDFDKILAIKTLRVMKSERNYDPLVPNEFNFFMKIVDKVVPGSEKVSKVFTGLLEEGWTAHNNEIEANRKKGLIDGQIMSYLKNINDKDDFEYTIGPLLKRGSLKSDFNVKIDKIFYKSNQIEAEHIWEELYEINERLEKHPIFSNRSSNAIFTAKKKFYENYINQFATFHQNTLNGTSGSLYGYLELSSGFKIKNKILVPDVPAGYEIGERFNSILPKTHKNPLELKVVKVLIIKSIKYRNGYKPEIGFWQLTLDKNNYIRRRFLTKMIANEPFLNPQPETEGKHAYEFLEKYGEYDKKNKLWKIPSSLFSEFTKNIPEGMKPPPSIKNMIVL